MKVKFKKFAQIITTLLSFSVVSSHSLTLAYPAPKTENKVLEQAKQNLPTNYFIIYAITERIARANDLDNIPWRIVYSPNYVVNAFATDHNLIVMEYGLMDKLEGNPSAIACVIGHEIGHHVRQHLGYGPAKEQQAKLEELQRAERDKLIAEQNVEIQKQLAGTVASGSVAAGREIGGTLGTAVGWLGVATGSRMARNSNNIEEIKAKIDKEAELRYQKRISEISQKQEFEADESGYIYSVTAGFDADGCQTAMDLLGRSHGAHLPGGTHPSPAERNERIENLIAEKPPETLKAEGKSNLDAKPVSLSYEEFSLQYEDGGTLSGLKILPITGTTKDALDGFLN